MSETAAAATRKIAGAGTGTRSVSDVDSAASAKPAVTMRMMVPKSVISVMANRRRPDFPALRPQRYTARTADAVAPTLGRVLPTAM